MPSSGDHRSLGSGSARSRSATRWVASILLVFALTGGPMAAGLLGQTGALRGVVVDSDTGLTLAGVAVSIPGLDRAVVTDLSGSFSIGGLEPGTYELQANYLGYGPVTQEVTVGEDVARLLLELSPSAFQLEGITVVGQRRGQAVALNQQLNAPNITNVVAADQIGRFPDANIGDAIKRIPGIVVIQDQGEARFGLVRGTEPRLNSVTINGERIPSAEAEVREVQLDLIPADMVAAVEVTKALTPDMDADAIGGSVNIVTRRAPASQRISATLGSGYNFLSEGPMGIGSGVFADRLAGGRLGVVLSGSYFSHQLGSDNIEAEWDEGDTGAYMSELQIREYQVDRVRRSISGAVDFELSDATTVTLSSIYNHRDDWENRFRSVFGLDEPSAGGATVAEIERETKGGINDSRIDNRRLEDQRTQSHSVGIEHLFSGGATWTASAQWAQASEDRPNERYINFVVEDVDVNADISNPRKPTVSPLSSLSTSAFEFDELTEEHQYTRDTDINVRTDLSFDLLEGASRVSLGARLRDKEKLRDNDFFEYSPMSGVETLADVQTKDYTNPDFLPGDYRVGELATEGYLGGLDLQDGSAFESELKVDEFLPGNFTADEQIIAGYAMIDHRLTDRASIIAGVRVENTSVDYVGNEFVEDDETSRELTGSESYTNVFPSLHLRYDLGNRRVLRAAWTNTISRPNYYDLVPYRIVNREDDELELGNPDLEPTRSMNFDVMLEQYFEDVGILSAGVFYKDITDFIFGYTLDDAPDPLTNQIFSKVTRPENGASASLFGFEVAFQRALWGGFGIYGNYTFTDSSTDGLPIEGRENEDLPLPGTSKHTGNVSLSYEHARFSLRASMNYQHDFIDPGELGDSAFFDRYYDQQTSVDLNGEIILTPSARFFFEANNLTDRPLRYYQGVSSRLMQEEFYDRRFQAGLKLDLR